MCGPGRFVIVPSLAVLAMPLMAQVRAPRAERSDATTAAVADTAPQDVRRDIGSASFVVPVGWTVRAGDASDHLSITKADSRYYCILSMFAPRSVDPDPDAEFTAEWNNVLRQVGVAPKATARRLGVRTVREAGVQSTIDGTPTYAGAHVMDLEHQIVTVISYTPDAKAWEWCRPDLDLVLASVKVNAAPTSAPTPTQASTPGAVTIHVSDLVGKWGNNGASTLGYVDANGNYSGTSTAFFGEWYTFAADGSYTYSFQGRANNHTIRETGAGRVTLSGDLLILDGTREGVRSTIRLRLLGFQPAKDGTAVLTLLEAEYPPTAGNIGLYKQAWIREPAKKQ